MESTSSAAYTSIVANVAGGKHISRSCALNFFGISIFLGRVIRSIELLNISDKEVVGDRCKFI